MNQSTMAKLDAESAGLSFRQIGVGVAFASLVVGVAGSVVGRAGAVGTVAGG